MEPTNPHAERFWIGDLECIRFVHSRGRGRPEWMFPDVASDALATPMAPYVDRGGRIEFMFSSLLVRVDRDVVLLDAGAPSDDPRSASGIERQLAAIDLEPSDISTVVISHGHLDHIGGLVRADVPVFSAARHSIGRSEFEHWVADGRDPRPGRILGVLAGAGLVDLVDGAGELRPGIGLLPTPGHTPGHLSVTLESRDAAAVYAGDVVAHEVNIRHPGWNHFSDVMLTIAADTRRELVERAARRGEMMIASHMVSRGWVVAMPDGTFDHLAEQSGGRVSAA